MDWEETETYHPAECVCFRKTHEDFGELSNMASGYPLLVNGVTIRTSEALYQACRFPNWPDVQKLIIDQSSPMAAKMYSKPHRREKCRDDWEHVCVPIMRWCLRIKLAQNWERFGRLLLSTGDRMIVEDSKRDGFWGAKPQPDGTLVGINKLGRLLRELREDLRKPTAESLKRVEPVPISDFQLYGKPIEMVDAS